MRQKLKKLLLLNKVSIRSKMHAVWTSADFKTMYVINNFSKGPTTFIRYFTCAI